MWCAQEKGHSKQQKLIGSEWLCHRAQNIHVLRLFEVLISVDIDITFSTASMRA